MNSTRKYSRKEVVVKYIAMSCHLRLQNILKATSLTNQHRNLAQAIYLREVTM